MALSVGDLLPEFTAFSADDSVFSSKSVLGKKNIILYFYPKDNTRVCTAQACSFRDHFEEFMNLDATVIGISSDSAASHRGFISKYRLPFTLLCDPDRKLRRLFGVENDLLGLIPGRTTYIIDREGVVRFIYDSMSGITHVMKALEFLKNQQDSLS